MYIYVYYAYICIYAHARERILHRYAIMITAVVTI